MYSIVFVQDYNIKNERKIVYAGLMSVLTQMCDRDYCKLTLGRTNTATYLIDKQEKNAFTHTYI